MKKPEDPKKFSKPLAHLYPWEAEEFEKEWGELDADSDNTVSWKQWYDRNHKKYLKTKEQKS